MFHIGCEKGVAISRFLRAGVESFRHKAVVMGGEVKVRRYNMRCMWNFMLL